MAYEDGAPGVSFTEITTYPSTVALLDTSTPTFFGVAEWGPLFTPKKLVGGFSAYQNMYGEHLSYSDLAYVVDNFHSEASTIDTNVGGTVFISRLAKLNPSLSDVADSVVRASVPLTGATTLPRGAYLLGTTSPALYLGGWAIPRDTSVVLKWTVDADGDAASASAPVTQQCDLIGYAAELLSPSTVTTTFTPAGGSTSFLEIRVAEGQNPLPILFTAASYTPVQLVDAINQQVSNCSVELTAGNKVRIIHDCGGTQSYLAITNGTSDILAYLGWDSAHLPTAIPSGVSNVANTMNVTLAEIKAAVTAVSTLVTVSTTVTPKKFNLTTVATGAAVELKFDSTETTAMARTIFGISTASVFGANSGTASPSLKVWAKYYGLKGNRISVKTTHNPIRASQLDSSDSSATDLTDEGIVAGRNYFLVPSLYGYAVDMVLRITSADQSQVEWVVIDRTESVIDENGDYTYRLYVTSDNTSSGVLQYTFAQADTSITSMEFDLVVYLDGVSKQTFTQLSINDIADNYFATVISDEFVGSNLIEVEPASGAAERLATLFPAALTTPVKLSGATLETEDDYSISDTHAVGSLQYYTGMYAIHKLRFQSQLVAYPNASAFYQKKMHAYLANRRDMFFVASVPTTDTGFVSISSAAAAFAWRDRNGFDSKYGALYFPKAVVDDPIGKGRAPQRTIDPVGNILGVYSRVDHIPAKDGGGCWSAPAGDGDFGQFSYVNKLSYTVDEDTELGMLNKAGINCLLARPGVIQIWGTRTLSSNIKWRYIPVTRLFIMAEQSVLLGTRFAVFRGNSKRWWDLQKEMVGNMMYDLWRNGAWVGDTAEEAYYVKMGISDGTMTAADRVNGRELGEFGGAPERPGEFIHWNVNQLTGGDVVIV